jgi:hypothetical protein
MSQPGNGGGKRRPAAEPRPADDPETTAIHTQDEEPDDDHRGRYVYCVIQTDEELSFGSIGIGTEPADVHTVNFRDIAAVTSATPLEVYDPARENVLAHERVNEAVMRSFTVIPMSFGTVFKTEQDIVELLRTAYDAFREVLGKMKNKLEFGLKVLWEPEIVISGGGRNQRHRERGCVESALASLLSRHLLTLPPRETSPECGGGCGLREWVAGGGG